jgi:ureidoacrylate peracid hydrolase
LTPTRQKPLQPDRSAILIVDMQNYAAHPDGGEFSGTAATDNSDFGYFFERLNRTTANIRALQASCRGAGIEVMYCVIESLTLDGRDRGLDYKITGFHVPKDSWDAKVLDAIAPSGDEIVFSKTSSSVFNSTNIDYVLRAMTIEQLVIVGIATDQCVESAVRDACDLGYLVTLVPDACATYTQERQDASEKAISGYCRQLSTASLVDEIDRVGAAI